MSVRRTVQLPLASVLILLVVVLAACDPGPTGDVGVSSEGGHFYLYQCSSRYGIAYAAVNSDLGMGRRVWSARKVEHQRAAARVELFVDASGYQTRGHQPRNVGDLAVGYLDDDQGVNMLMSVLPLGPKIADGHILLDTEKVERLPVWLRRHPGCLVLSRHRG